MYCKNCGKQNPDNARFCSKCGSPMTPSQLTVDPDSSKKPKKKKNKLGAVASVLVVLLAVIGGRFVGTLLAGAFGATGLPDVEDDGVVSTDYAMVFSYNGLSTPTTDFFGQDVKTTAYAIHHGEGMVENLEYVYDKGLVYTMVDTIYVPVGNLDYAAKSELDSIMQDNLSEYTSLSFCDFDVTRGNDHYVYRMTFFSLDVESNVHQLCKTGMIVLPEGESQVDCIGIKQSEDALLASGFAKR